MEGVGIEPAIQRLLDYHLSKHSQKKLIMVKVESEVLDKITIRFDKVEK